MDDNRNYSSTDPMNPVVSSTDSLNNLSAQNSMNQKNPSPQPVNNINSVTGMQPSTGARIVNGRYIPASKDPVNSQNSVPMMESPAGQTQNPDPVGLQESVYPGNMQNMDGNGTASEPQNSNLNGRPQQNAQIQPQNEIHTGQGSVMPENVSANNLGYQQSYPQNHRFHPNDGVWQPGSPQPETRQNGMAHHGMYQTGFGNQTSQSAPYLYSGTYLGSSQQYSNIQNSQNAAYPGSQAQPVVQNMPNRMSGNPVQTGTSVETGTGQNPVLHRPAQPGYAGMQNPAGHVPYQQKHGPSGSGIQHVQPAAANPAPSANPAGAANPADMINNVSLVNTANPANSMNPAGTSAASGLGSPVNSAVGNHMAGSGLVGSAGIAGTAAPANSGSPANSADNISASGQNAGSMQQADGNTVPPGSEPPKHAATQSASQEDEEIPILTSAYVEPKKNNTIVLVLAGLLMVVIICATLVLMVGNSSNKNIGSGTRYREERNYLVLSPSATMDKAGAGSSNGVLNPGQSVFIEATLTTSDGQVWGMISEKEWVLLSDPDYIYLLDESLADYKTEEENREYIAQKDVSVYTVPGGISKSISRIKEGDTVFVLETAIVEDGTWGRIGLNQWVLIEKDGNEVLVINEDAVEVKEDEDKDKETDEDTDNPGAKVVEGFKTGIYELDFAMKIRREPAFDAEEVKTLDAGTLIRVAWLRKVEERDSIWGELDERGSGYWVCLKASGTTYATWDDPDAPSDNNSNNNYEPSDPAVQPSEPSAPDYGTPDENNPPADNPDFNNPADDQDPYAPDGPIVDDQPYEDPYSNDQNYASNDPSQDFTN